MNYKEKYNLWLNNKDLEENLKNELLEMTDDKMKEAFTEDLEFGTGGMRGIIGAGTNRMNIYTVRKATLGFARYLLSLNSSKSGVVISHDNRLFSREFAIESAKVLETVGIKPYLFSSLRPTPELSFAVRELNAIGGIMITASHNPKEYNGYKIYDEDGCQLTVDAANKVIDEINKIEDPFSIEVNSIHGYYIDDIVDPKFIQCVNSLRIQDVDKNFKIVYTPLHGTGGVHFPNIMKMNGFNCIPVEEQMIFDPEFSNVQASNPEEKLAFTEAIELAKKENAKIIIATDPDADRVGIAVLHNGEYELLNGNQTGAIILDYIIKMRKQKNAMPKNPYIFTTIVSSSLPIEMAKKNGINYKTVLTGFKFIGEQIKNLKADGSFIFGYEESYGYLLTDQMRDKDSMGTSLLICEIVGYYNSLGKTLIDALNDIYEEYGYYYESLTNINLKGLEGKKKIDRIMEHFRTNEVPFDVVLKSDYKKSISINKDGTQNEIDLPKSNVLKYELSDGSWFVLRPSGTEPKIKFYFGAKADSMANTLNRIDEMKKVILDIVDQIK